MKKKQEIEDRNKFKLFRIVKQLNTGYIFHPLFHYF